MEKKISGKVSDLKNSPTLKKFKNNMSPKSAGQKLNVASAKAAPPANTTATTNTTPTAPNPAQTTPITPAATAVTSPTSGTSPMIKHDAVVAKLLLKQSLALHLLANEPTIGLYRIQEHVQKSGKVLSQMKSQIIQQKALIEQTTLDIDFSIESLKTTYQASIPFSNISLLLRKSMNVVDTIQAHRRAQLHQQVQQQHRQHGYQPKLASPQLLSHHEKQQQLQHEQIHLRFQIQPQQQQQQGDAGDAAAAFDPFIPLTPTLKKQAEVPPQQQPQPTDKAAEVAALLNTITNDNDESGRQKDSESSVDQQHNSSNDDGRGNEDSTDKKATATDE